MELREQNSQLGGLTDECGDTQIFRVRREQGRVLIKLHETLERGEITGLPVIALKRP
jgi:hypothetical protein